ncbi:MAG: 50S ribosomal protein L23 [Deltaproteobacteria bacterium]|nr:50S ribosomal protein L23 [Deltaproteobacteria bacterium]
MNSNDIILKPIISEKTTDMMGQNKYVFKVPMKANKIMIRKAIKDIFGVKPRSINIIRMRGKSKRVRYQYGNKSAYKKAIVTLDISDKIEIFEGQ